MEGGWGLRSAGVGVCVIMESKQRRNGLPGNTQRGGYYNTFYRIHYNYTIVFCCGVLCWTRHPLHYVTKTKNHCGVPGNTQEGRILQFLTILLYHSIVQYLLYGIHCTMLYQAIHRRGSHYNTLHNPQITMVQYFTMVYTVLYVVPGNTHTIPT